MEFLLKMYPVFIIFFIVGSLFFFLFQAIHYGRSPIRVFVGPISRKEFKVLLDILMGLEMKRKSDFMLDATYVFDEGKYKFHNNGWSNSWQLNGVQLSFFQERAILKLIERKKLKAQFLTKAGQILFTKGNN